MRFTAFATFIVAASAASISPALKRGDDGEIECNVGNVVSKTTLERNNVVEGQNYLRSGIVMGAEDGKCSRVSCSNNAAVWLCNNSGADINDMDAAIAADYVDHVFDACQESGLYCNKCATGRQHNSDGWNIEVGRNQC